MNIKFKWVGGATWILRINNIKIACDPVLCPEGHIQDYKYFKTKRINNPVFDDIDFKKINLWLLTHNHEDHIDAPGFKMIKKESTIISHTGLKTFFKKNGYNDVRYLDWREEAVIPVDDITVKIKAVPAIHAKKSLFGGVIGNGNGYFLEITGPDSKCRVYVTGDSVYNKNIDTDIGNSNIDLIIANAGSAMVGKSLFSPIIGRITNNIQDIIKMNFELKPKILIPVHWGTFTHYSEIITAESFVKHDNIKILKVGECMTVS